MIGFLDWVSRNRIIHYTDENTFHRIKDNDKNKQNWTSKYNEGKDKKEMMEEKHIKGERKIWKWTFE